MVKILEGLRIVEGSAFVAAPLAGMTLAQMGADVIRFDRLQGGLDARRWPVTDSGASLFWAGNALVARAFTGAIPPFSLAFWRCFRRASLACVVAIC